MHHWRLSIGGFRRAGALGAVLCGLGAMTAPWALAADPGKPTATGEARHAGAVATGTGSQSVQESGSLSAAVAKALDRSTEASGVFRLEDGGTGVDLDGRFLHVMGLTPRQDGSFDGWCVDELSAARKLLGLGGAKSVTRLGQPHATPATAVPGEVSKTAGAVNGTLALDPSRLAGADELGRPLLYTPDPLEQGSSISHWDLSASPDLLMEPTASPRVPFREVDLTLPHFRDLGWPEGASTITVRVQDDPGEGFRDLSIVAEAPANPGGTTLGGQRLAAMEWAAAVWSELLGSAIEINIAADFDELDCDPEGGAVLAAAGARFLFADFTGAPRAATWYHGALAEALAGENLSATEDGRPPNTGDLVVTFNSGIDEACLAPSFRYYYGLDGNTPAGQASFAMVALHEIAHGLGFATFVDKATGSFPLFAGAPRIPDIYTVFTFDAELGLHWDVMTAAERRASAVNTGDVVWDGPQSVAAAPAVLDNRPRLRIDAPRWLAGSYPVQTAQFGPPLSLLGVSGELAVARDGTDAPTLGCETLVNAAEVAGRIAIIDRGACLFTDKVKNAQDAGAVAVLIVNNQPQGLPPMGGSDPAIVIPSVGISRADGTRLKQALGVGPPAARSAGGRFAVAP